MYLLGFDDLAPLSHRWASGVLGASFIQCTASSRLTQDLKVDFKCRGHYKASTSPKAGRFERDETLPSPSMEISNPGDICPPRPWLHQNNWMNPMLFFECACELIVELTGLGDE